MKEPTPGMDKRKSKAESLYLKGEREWYEGEPGENIQRQTALFYTGVLYGQTPIDLLRDPTIKPLIKVLFAIYHTHCNVKFLEANPCTFISQKRIGREYLGCSQQAVSKATIEMKKEGWCTILSLGKGRSNIVILHDRKGKRITAEEKRNFIKLVKIQQGRHNLGL